ncbi:TPA: hypothetical protein ACW0GM_005233 [Klebsiella pneumoniae]
MSRINKQLNESNGIIYTSAFVETISKVDIPAVIYLKSAGCFDDKYINSTSDSWVFDYSGSRCYAHFRRDKISNRLTKYICFRYASAKCPAQIPDVLHAWSLATDHCITKSAFTISKAILSFSPPDYQAAVARGEAALPTITPTDLRHNVGHSLAMQGGSAEEIAHILGHTSLTVAKYYILATPALALIRAKALGTNPVWQSMVAMMLTGELTSSTEWQGQRVVGIVGDQLHDGIGGCTRGDGECPFCEVRCCYGCLYYRPFTDGDHQAVLESVVKEVDELISISDSVGNARNPLISIHETTQFEIQSVIARCRFHQEKGGVR